MHYIGKVQGFDQRRQAEDRQEEKQRSFVTQTKMRMDLMGFGNESLRPDNPNVRSAISKAAHIFKLPQRVKMIHLNDVFKKELDIWNKSTGLPWKNNGYETMNDIRNDPKAIQNIRCFWARIKKGKNTKSTDCLAYQPYHVADAWNYPATITFGEAMYALPLIKAYDNRFSFYKNFSGLDFQKFNKTVPKWLIETAFDIIFLNIDFKYYQDHGIPKTNQNIKMMEYIKDYFIDTTIRTPNGLRFRKSSGIASGSYFTQLVETIVSCILCQWICLEQHRSFIDLADILSQGDESISATGNIFDLTLANQLMESIGMFKI